MEDQITQEQFLNRAQGSGMAGRLHSRAVLEEEIVRAQRRIDALLALRNNINWNDLTEEQEGHLWGLFLDMNRR